MRFYEVLLGLYLINSTFAVYTAVRIFPSAIYEIDESTLNAKKILDTEDVGAVSITNDPLTGHMFVITGATADEGITRGAQTLNRLCEGELYPIAPLSPPTISFSCLTSGPNGVYAAGFNEANEVSIGKLDTTTGEWTNLAPLLPPYDSAVVAQNDKGVIHYINGNGKTFINPGSKPQMDVLRGTKFPPGFKDFCGEFDDDGHIIAGTRVGGISKYNLQSETIEISQINDTSEFFFLNDITVGSVSDTCPSDAPSTTSPTGTLTTVSPAASPTSSPTFPVLPTSKPKSSKKVRRRKRIRRRKKEET